MQGLFASLLGAMAIGACVLVALAFDGPLHGTGAASATAPASRVVSDSTEAIERVRAFVGTWCFECHGDADGKGELDLAALLVRSVNGGGKFANALQLVDDSTDDSDSVSDLQRWRTTLERVEAGTMPPRKASKPPAAEVERFALALRSLLPAADHRAASPSMVVRRVTRGEYRRSVRDLLGVEIDLGELLPTDDPGNGFDTASDGLSLSPLVVERFIEAAERVALAVAPDEQSWREQWIFEGVRLERSGAGAMANGAQVLWGIGRVSAKWSAPVAGRYRLRVRSWGQQAGPDPVRFAIRLDRRRTIDTIEVPNGADDPLLSEHFCEIADAGPVRIDVEFLNDYWKPDHPDPRQRDRNAAVVSIEVEGPLDTPPLPPRLELAPGEVLDAERVDAFVHATATRAFRRPVEGDEVRALRQVGGADASPSTQLHGAIAAILASPSFLLRADGGLPRGYAAASRLAGFLWSSVPDEALLQAAAAGALDTGVGRARVARAMLDDPRSRALAEEFATQWLSVRELDRRAPDPSRFSTVDAALIASMREETIRWFDALLRERLPLRELITAEWSIMDERLMRHAGLGADAELAPADRDGWRRVRVERGGVLRQPSVLLATSNPTRTSPVKRGRFVLAALLDEAPPPPPPGVPQLPPEADDQSASIAEMMARHRSDPACASCHRSMDSIGLLLERFDAVGRVRAAPMTDAELPDGRIVHSPDELSTALLADSAVARTVARRLLVYATGRALTPTSREACDRLVDQLGPDATLHELVVRLVELDVFLPDDGGPRS